MIERVASAAGGDLVIPQVGAAARPRLEVIFVAVLAGDLHTAIVTVGIQLHGLLRSAASCADLRTPASRRRRRGSDGVALARGRATDAGFGGFTGFGGTTGSLAAASAHAPAPPNVELEADRRRPRRDQAHALADLVDDAALRRFE